MPGAPIPASCSARSVGAQLLCGAGARIGAGEVHGDDGERAFAFLMLILLFSRLQKVRLQWDALGAHCVLVAVCCLIDREG